MYIWRKKLLTYYYGKNEVDTYRSWSGKNFHKLQRVGLTY